MRSFRKFRVNLYRRKPHTWSTGRRSRFDPHRLTAPPRLKTSMIESFESAAFYSPIIPQKSTERWICEGTCDRFSALDFFFPNGKDADNTE